MPVTLAWPHEQRRVVAVVKLIDGAWRITDLEYPEGGTLSALLATPDGSRPRYGAANSPSIDR